MKKPKVYLIVILILAVAISAIAIKARAFNVTIQWHGGTGFTNDPNHWSGGNIPTVSAIEGINPVLFTIDSGNGTVYVNVNMTTGPITITTDCTLKIQFLNNTKWTIVSVNIPSFGPSEFPSETGFTVIIVTTCL